MSEASSSDIGTAPVNGPESTAMSLAEAYARGFQEMYGKHPDIAYREMAAALAVTNKGAYWQFRLLEQAQNAGFNAMLEVMRAQILAEQ